MEKVIIIGAGPAGISAALYAVRGNLDPLVINNGIGALEKAEKIENYYGLEHPLSGQELYDTGIAQAKALGVRILDAQVLGVGGFDTFVVKTTEGEFETQSLILATGSKRAAPKIPGVKEFEGKGVSYCAICDAFFYRGKDVAVLGNGDFAMHEAKELSNTASTVTIYTNGEEPEFTEILCLYILKSCIRKVRHFFLSSCTILKNLISILNINLCSKIIYHFLFFRCQYRHFFLLCLLFGEHFFFLFKLSKIRLQC